MAGLVSPESLERVRQASDIVEVISACVPLKRAGANFVALCPFHKEKTPSFSVNPQKQIFYCFGCHKGGDVFRFVQDYEGIGFLEAVRRLADRARIVLDFGKDERQRQTQFLKEQLLRIHDAIAQRWHTALTQEADGEPARAYLANRGVGPEAIQLFRLGFAPDRWDDTVNWAKTRKFDLNQVEQAGLIVRKEDSGHYYDRFRGRLVFPISDDQGRIIAFSGRTLSADPQTAKYVNSPETPIFTKGRVFYGLDKAKRALLEAGSALVCEGQLDLIACYLAGIHNVVAPQGTAFTPEHARILKRYVEEVVLCFDADTAGQQAAVRVQESLLASGLGIRVVTLPAPHDPDSYIREHGGPAFRALIAQPKEFFEFYLDQLCSRPDVNTDKGQRAVVRAMAEAVAKTGDAVLLDKYAQRTAMRLAAHLELPVSPDAVRTQFQKTAGALRTPTVREEHSPTLEAEAAARPSAHEFWLLRLLLLDHTLLDQASAALELHWIAHPLVREIVSARLAPHARGEDGIARLLNEFPDPAAQNLIGEALSEARSIPNREQQLADVLRRLRNQHLDRRLLGLTQRLAAAGLSETERVDLLRQQQEIHRAKRQPLVGKQEGAMHVVPPNSGRPTDPRPLSGPP